MKIIPTLISELTLKQTGGKGFSDQRWRKTANVLEEQVGFKPVLSFLRVPENGFTKRRAERFHPDVHPFYRKTEQKVRTVRKKSEF